MMVTKGHPQVHLTQKNIDFSQCKDILKCMESLRYALKDASKQTFTWPNIDFEKLSSWKNTLNIPFASKEALNSPNLQSMFDEMNQSHAKLLESCMPPNIAVAFRDTLYSEFIKTTQLDLSSILADNEHILDSILYPTSNVLKMLSSERTKLVDIMQSFDELYFQDIYLQHVQNTKTKPNILKHSKIGKTPHCSQADIDEFRQDVVDIANSVDKGGLEWQQQYEVILSKWKQKNIFIAFFLSDTLQKILTSRH